MGTAPITANATFSATLVDEWIRQGVTAAFIAPGSRSTPMALALASSALAVHVFHDERSAAFAALGHGLATNTPAVVICSSGTAGTHFHAAVVEAGLSCVPMLVCTADRPPELWGRGAPQVIDQTDLFGDAVRAFAEPGPPEETDPSSWRALAAVTYGAATDVQPGPVHLNLSFRDPLTGRPDGLPPSDPSLAAGPVVSPTIDPSDAAELAGEIAGKTGVIVVGRGQFDPAAVDRLARRLRWTVLADHRSGCRHEGSIRHADALLRNETFAGQVQPDVLLRLGEIVSSKSISQWISACSAAGTRVLSSQPWGRLIDPEAVADVLLPEAELAQRLLAALPTDAAPYLGAATLLTRWTKADNAAQAAIAAELPADSEPAIAQAAVEAPPAGGALVVASSMPVRDVEWYGPNRNDIDVISNRGANGIDGTIATAIGVALTGKPTVCLVGDVAFLHDSTSLVALAQRSLDLTIVVNDNDGGAIFSFLPQHSILGEERYEQLFGTPHGTDLAALVAAHGITVETWPTDLTPQGVRVVITTSNRAENLELHNRLVAAVAKTVSH